MINQFKKYNISINRDYEKIRLLYDVLKLNNDDIDKRNLYYFDSYYWEKYN